MRALLGALVFAVILGLVAWKAGPGILRDWTLRNDYVPVMAEVGGECSGYVVVVTYCDVTLTTEAGTTQDTLFFVDFNTGDYTVDVVASPGDPSVLSTSLGIEKFWNRIATLVGLGLVFLYVLFAGIGAAKRGNDAAPA